MGASGLMPHPDEVRKWLLSTLKHSMHVEYFLYHLGIGHNDPQRPHDLTGEDNKFDWNVINGLALQYRPNAGGDFFRNHIFPSIERHRRQYHHQKWESHHPDDITLPNSAATEADLLVGGVDSVCAILESRGYQQACSNYDEVAHFVQRSPPHKIPWMLRMIGEMQKIPRPNLDSVLSLKTFGNVGIASDMYETTRQRIDEALKSLRSDVGYQIHLD